LPFATLPQLTFEGLIVPFNVTTMNYDFKRVLQLFFVLAFAINLNAEFTQHFRDFIIQHYGRETKQQLERLDMGVLNMGSFGGKLDANENITNRVIHKFEFEINLSCLACNFCSRRNSACRCLSRTQKVFYE
jgi:hypothetical protein